ncbi:MAG: DciA family protein [Patescibacteria group bacterium]|jgi:hypothetical protein
MLQLRDVLFQRLRQSGISGRVSAAQIVNAAQEVLLEIFPEDLSTRMAAAHVKGATLTIKVESPAVGQELKFHEMEIVNKLLKKVPRSGVQHIRFCL